MTLRDLVHAIPYYGIQQGLLTVEKAGKINAFSGRILEIEGLPDLKVAPADRISSAVAVAAAALTLVRSRRVRLLLGGDSGPLTAVCATPRYPHDRNPGDLSGSAVYRTEESRRDTRESRKLLRRA